MEGKNEADFMPTAVRKRNYGTVDVAGVFHWRPDALDTEEEYNKDYKIWDRNLTTGIKQWRDYVNNGEYIFLAIQGQMERSLWDKTKDDAQFVAIQTLKCPIALIKLMKDRSTGTMTGVWQPLALITQIQKIISHLQNPIRGGSKSIGDYKREVESFVDTTCRLGGLFAFGTAVMIKICRKLRMLYYIVV